MYVATLKRLEAPGSGEGWQEVGSILLETGGGGMVLWEELWEGDQEWSNGWTVNN